MLERLELSSFQVHAELDVDLHAPIVAITGSSDSGKSSILRALRWLCTGQAPRSPMPTWGSDAVQVTLNADGRTIERRKSKSENCYVIDGKVLAGDVQRKAVPDEIAQLLNVGPQNFQTQHSSHFWLADTAGEVSRQLNSIVNLGLIDDSLAAVASELRDARQAEALCRERLEQAQQRRSELKWVEEADAALTVLEGMNEVIQGKRQDALGLAQLVEAGKRADLAARSGLRNADARQTALQKLDAIARRHAELTEEATLLNNLIGEHQCSVQRAKEARARASQLEADLLQNFKTCPVCQRPMKPS